MTYFVMTAITVPLLFALFFRDFLDWAHVTIPGMAALAIRSCPAISLDCRDLRAGRGGLDQDNHRADADRNRGGCCTFCDDPLDPGWPGRWDQSASLRSRLCHAGFLPGFWAAIILGILAFSGFDVVATAAEEAQAPREHVPRVLIFAVLGIGLFWALNAWCIDSLRAAGRGRPV